MRRKTKTYHRSFIFRGATNRNRKKTGSYETKKNSIPIVRSNNLFQLKKDDEPRRISRDKGPAPLPPIPKDPPQEPKAEKEGTPPPPPPPIVIPALPTPPSSPMTPPDTPPNEALPQQPPPERMEEEEELKEPSNRVDLDDVANIPLPPRLPDDGVDATVSGSARGDAGSSSVKQADTVTVNSGVSSVKSFEIVSPMEKNRMNTSTITINSDPPDLSNSLASNISQVSCTSFF